MNIKQGYKQTEIGIIPEDWEVKKLSDISQLITKGTTPKKFSETGINFIKIECFEGNLINQEKCAFIDIITHSTELKRSILQEGDILFAIAGATIGKCNVVQSEILPANTNQALAIVRLKQNENREFVYRLLASYKMQKYITDNVSVGAQPNLNLEQIGNFLFAYPLFSEQTAIATALSDIDALIGELDKLIAKKQGIKQATMQQLLTGKKRLAGFSGEWEEKTIFQLADNKKEFFDDGDWIEAQHITDEGIRLIQTGNIGIGSFVEKESKKYIYNDSFVRLACKELKKGDLLICRLAEPAGRACVFPEINEEKVITSVDVTIFRPRCEIANRYFLVNVFSTKHWFKLISEMCGGTTHKRISRGALGKIKIILPSLQEQTAIANILSDMDAEISQLEGRRAKMGELKQGMMQELLTGRIRLTGGRYL
jgi:type I restriction enzyme S subunit